MNKIDLCALLGKAITDTEIQSLLTVIQIDPAKVEMKKGEYTAYATNEELNITLLFEKDFVILAPLDDKPRKLSPDMQERIGKIKTYPEGTLFLSRIVCGSNYLFDNGYSIKYDFRINKDTTKQKLYEKIGEPYIVNERRCAIGWLVGEQAYNLGYDKESLIVNWVNFPFFV